MKSLSEAKSPLFNSANLNKIMNTVSEVFDNHQSDINAVSSDIRALEEYIRAKHVQVVYEEAYESSKENCRYYLKWGKPESDSKEFRLLCQTSHYNFEEGQWFLALDEKPLIEQPLSVRMSTYRYLSDFLQNLANEIKIFSRGSEDTSTVEHEFNF